MPTYVYETVPDDPSTPRRRFEVVQRMTDEPLKVHPDTGEPVRKIITGGMGFIGARSTESDSACGLPNNPCCGGVCGVD